MRRVWYSVAMSLDGFIAGPNGEYDWIPDEPEIDWGAFMGRFDTLLMGRRSWEAAQAVPKAPAMPGFTTWVFSRTMDPAAHPGVNLVRDNIPEALAAMRRAPGKDIWLFGGGDLFRSLLLLGQVDRVEVGLVPALLGRGIRFLPEMDRLVTLRLLESHRYPTGITLLTYEVVKP